MLYHNRSTCIVGNSVNSNNSSLHSIGRTINLAIIVIINLIDIGSFLASVGREGPLVGTAWSGSHGVG